MKRLALLTAALVAPLGAETLSRGDRDFAMSHLHAGAKVFLDSLAGLSEEQWKFKPAADRWSIAEVAEHITVTEDFLFKALTEKILKSEPVKERKPASREQDEQFLKMILDRSQKRTAPEPVRPSTRWASREALIDEFKKLRERTLAYVETTQDDLRGFAGENFDGWQLLLLMAAHPERHTAQINEVKADPNYPKR